MEDSKMRNLGTGLILSTLVGVGGGAAVVGYHGCLDKELTRLHDEANTIQKETRQRTKNTKSEQEIRSAENSCYDTFRQCEGKIIDVDQGVYATVKKSEALCYRISGGKDICGEIRALVMRTMVAPQVNQLLDCLKEKNECYAAINKQAERP